MYLKWKNYSKEHPYLSILLVAIIASVIGITIQYLIDKTFVSGGFWVTIVLILIQFNVARKSK